MPFTLQSVAVVLRNESGADALEQAGPLVSQWLGPAPHLSLSAACSFQSPALLDWIWACSCPLQQDSSTPAASNSWALTRFLCSDEFYSRWQFAEAARVAVERSDTQLLQWLFDRFQPAVVPSDVVALAVLKGDLAVLQFLAANADTSRGLKVQWTDTVVSDALQRNQLETAHWLHQHAPFGTMTEEVHEWAVKAAMDAGDWDFCRALLPRGRCILDYADFCATPAVVEWKLDCGYFQRDWTGAVVAIHDLASTDHLDLIRRLSDQHDPPPQDLDWMGEWRDALSDACIHGNLDVIKFLVGHPTGQQAVDEMGRGKALANLMRYPAAKGNIEAMQYLLEQGADGPVEKAMVSAISSGQVDAVKWLLERFPRTSEIPEYCFMDEAARRGRVDLLQLFQSLELSGVPGDSTPASPPPLVEAEEDQPTAIAITVDDADRHRKIIPNVARSAMNLAAVGGHVETLEWLASNRSEGCTAHGIELAVSNGHLGVASWLMRRFPELTPARFSAPLSKNKFDVLLFLHVNYPEAFTPDFVQSVLQPRTRRPSPNDVQIKDWLKQHYPVPDVPEGQGGRAHGLAGRIAENIAQQIARQLGGDFRMLPGQQGAGQQGPAMPNTALAMVMNNIMVRVEHGDGDEDDGDEDGGDEDGGDEDMFGNQTFGII
ncbi:hypothetical protein PF008_g23453 [Phytophthora fragariae]|uniref:Uncharacterized protein n=1 Tax=Phytophthora fragariae TaxID=53985 RepID=A0A6G0QRN4_9STRA|nr:hypothetical protein PF008_g23453 [Phytophthora fragariae]